MEPVVTQGSFRAYGHTIGPAQRALEAWVNGRSLSPLIGWQTEYANRTEPRFDGMLVIEGKKQPGVPGLTWSVTFAQVGYPERNGIVGGAASAEDACDRACELIREDEAERLAAVVMGLA